MKTPERPKLGRRRPPPLTEPDFTPVYKAAIENALRWAWNEVQLESLELVQSGREEQITERMQRALNEQDRATGRRLAPGLQGFETVSRGAKVTTSDCRIEKAPDLVFRLVVGKGVRHRGDWGMFVECKIIGPERGHSPDIYCSGGLAKFVRGEYAPRMRSGMMVAYVRDRRRPYASLLAPLSGAYQTILHKPGREPEKSISTHERSSLAQPCVDISVTHLWLDVTTA